MEIHELNKLCESYDELKEEKDNLELAIKEINNGLKEIELKIIEVLEENELPNYRSSVGLFSRKEVTNYAKEDWELLRNYLEEQGVFNQLATVHHKTLAGYIKEEKLRLEEQGIYDFEVPGVKESQHVTIAYRKNK